MRKYILIFFSLAMGVSLSSCSLEPTLADDISTDVPDVTSMRQVMNGSYSMMASSSYWGRNMIIAGEVRADNVYSTGKSGRFIRMSQMDLLPSSGDVYDMYYQMYLSLAGPNILINLDLASVDGAEADKKHVLGEAYAARAMVHFDLLRLYGQVYSPGDLGIVYKTGFKTGDVQQARGTIAENKQMLYSDIANAIKYLKEGASSQFAGNKTTFSLDAAYALKARVAIYFRDYQKALDATNELIGKYSLVPASSYAAFWSTTNIPQASIFELAMTPTDNPGIDGIAYIYRGNSYGDVVCFNNMIADVFGSTSTTDVRASSTMIDEDGQGVLRNMGKYPHMGNDLGIDNIKVFRYAEVVLNHAEALLGTGDPSGALTFLNMIPNHRNGDTYTQATYENILKERRKELLFEGFRFFDLARFGKDIPAINPTLANHGLVEAGSTKFAFPIPLAETDANKKVEQNPGY